MRAATRRHSEDLGLTAENIFQPGTCCQTRLGPKLIGSLHILQLSQNRRLDNGEESICRHCVSWFWGVRYRHPGFDSARQHLDHLGAVVQNCGKCVLVTSKKGAT